MADAPASIVPLFNPDGDLIDVPTASVPVAIRQGWRQATPGEVAAYEREQKFGTTGQKVATFAEGVGEGVLGPVIPAVERAFGVPAEDIRGRQETNPVTHGAGVATGIVGSIVAPIPKGLKAFTLPGAAAKVGEAARVAMPVAEGLAGRALTSGAGMAAETALFGAADVAERAVLKDPNLTGESALATVGVSGLIGFGLGAGGTVGKELFSAGFKKAYDAAQRGYVRAVTAGAPVADAATSPAAAAAEQTRERTVATFMLQHKQEISGFEKMVPGVAEEISAASPETAAWLLKNKEAIADFERSFPGITKAMARSSPETAERMLQQRGKLITDYGERIKFADQQGKAVQGAYDTVDEALKDAFRSARPAEVEALAKAVPQETADAQVVAVRDRLKAAISEIANDPAMYEQNYAANLRKLVQRLDKVSPTVEVTYDALGNKVEKFVPGASPAEVYKALNETKQRLADFINFDKKPSLKVADTVNAFKSTYHDLRSMLEDEGVWGQLGVRQKEFNAAASAFFDARSELERRLMEGRVGDKEMSVTKVNAWMNKMADPRGAKKTDAFNNYAEAGKRLADQMEKSGVEVGPKVRAELERLQKITADIEERAAITDIVESTLRPGIRGSGPAIQMESQVARAVLPHIPGGSVISTVEGVIKSAASVPHAVGVLSAVERMAQKTANAVQAGVNVIFRPAEAAAAAGAGNVVKPADFPKVAETIRAHAADLEGTAGKLAQATSPIAGQAPDTTAAVQGTAARAVSHLAEHLPTRQQSSPLDPPFVPSQSELSAFSRRLEVAENPVSVLAHVRAGTVTPEHLEALSAIYPSLGAEMRAQLMDRVAQEIAGGKAIPYRTRLGLSAFLGGNLDSTTTPEALSANQKAFASINAQQKANEAAQQQAMAKITVASRSQTPAQSAAYRRT